MRKLLVLLLGFANMHTYAQTSATDKKAEEVLPKVIEWRRHFHQNPELSNREFNTSKFVADRLKAMGIEVKTGIAKTGVVGILKGGNPGPVIALRADMDALPVMERSGLPFASKVKSEYVGDTVPVMHACGHDAHMAILLGTAEVLAGMKKDLKGTIKFIFQPAEEGPPGDEKGGASLMVEEGVMDNPKVDYVIGLHVGADVPLGNLLYKPGAFMASADWFEVKIKGKQAHGSAPWTGVDPVVIGAQIINNIQTIVSRQMNLVKAPAVFTIGRIEGGIRENIIPEEIILKGSIRSLDAAMQKQAHESLKTMVTHTAEASGATATVSISGKTLVTFNDTALTRRLLPSLEKAAGKDKVILGNWQTGSEDFSYYGEKAPAFFFYLGVRDPKFEAGKAPGHHTPDFYINDSKLDVGVKAFLNAVMELGK